MNKTKNRVDIRGFVGRYIKLPSKRGDPARFDVATVERFRAEGSGQLITDKNWHTVRSFDVEKVEEEIHTGALVEVEGWMSTALVDKHKHVEITADYFEVLLTQSQRDTLREAYEEDADDEEVLARP